MFPSRFIHLKKLIPFLAAMLLPAGLFAQKTVIHAGHHIDVMAEKVRGATTVVIEDGKIVELQNGYAEIEDADEVIDLKDKYIMPGLMDMHTHLSSQTAKGAYIKRFQKYPADFALMAVKYLKRTLMAGFTTVRDVGGREGVDLALRDAVRRGDIVGPRMFVAGQSLAVLGGHADGTNSYREDIVGVPGTERGIVNGVESARRAALLALKRGADQIKITATAGVLSLAANGSAPQFTEEEIRVIVETARDFGKKVTAHAHGAEGLKRAVRAGVGSIEHGSFLDAEGMELMKKHNCYLIPTLTAGASVADSAKIEGYYSPIVVPKALEIGPAIQGTFAKAWKAGVPIAFGTDAGVFKHGKNGLEFGYMVEAGMPAMKAIKSATVETSKLLEQQDKLGTLEAGKMADIVAVDGNPIDNIKLMSKITFVMKEGVVYKHK